MKNTNSEVVTKMIPTTTSIYTSPIKNFSSILEFEEKVSKL